MESEILFKIEDGSFSYGSSLILQNLHFTLQQGKFYGLIGPNGSGKSTLIDLLVGTKSLGEGSISFKSLPLNCYGRKELAKSLALVPQKISIGFDFSVYDVVLMGRHPHIPRFSSPSAEDLAIVNRTLQLLDIDHLKNRSVSHLSGGEQQRVIVARALAQNTEVILLDEATSSLDIEHTFEIMQVLRSNVKKSNITIIAAIHDLNLAAAFCDEFIVLKDCGIYTLGPVTQVLTSELLREVFSVTGKVLHGPEHPRIEYEMLKPSPPSELKH